MQRVIVCTAKGQKETFRNKLQIQSNRTNEKQLIAASSRVNGDQLIMDSTHDCLHQPCRMPADLTLDKSLSPRQSQRQTDGWEETFPLVQVTATDEFQKS